MPEPAGQAWRTEAGTQLFYGTAEAEFIAPERSNLSGSPQEAADLVRGHLCRAKERTQFNADIAARFRGSGGSLSPFSDRFELEADDMGHEMTPVSVFFSAQIPIADFLRPLCQQLHKCVLFYSQLTSDQAVATTSYRPDGLASNFTAQFTNHIANP